MKEIAFSGDGTMKIWNTKLPQKATTTLEAHDAEVLTCSWSKYDGNLLATGGSDGLIRGWDLRNLDSPVFELKVQFNSKYLKSRYFQHSL